ncbi:ABC transporter permease [Actinoallomurus sp. NBC_01490]|uniref:ABC transporter permease n=1 Tax=Actinoallomurus sp. NBC_01490 TaxID=2903557 RepID=UPI002E3750D0|nr:ABC transporter permease [Actinoallomurus sp. NBC_01490]
MTAQALGRPHEVRRRLASIGSNGTVVWLVCLLLAIFLAVRNPGVFLGQENIANLLSQTVVLALVAMGEMLVILTGGIDLSVGSMATLTAVLTAGLIDGYPIRVTPVLIGVLLIGVLTGVFHGFLVTRARMVPFVVTISTFYLLEGIAYAYSSTPVGAIPDDLARFAVLNVGPIPVIFIIVLVIALALAWGLSRTRLGRHIYATGGDPAIARSAGINVTRVTITCYAICSALAALAGFMLASKATVGTPSAGTGLELSAITAVVLGGTSMFGGRGKIVGVAGGVLLLALVENTFTLLHVSSFYQDLVRGAVIVAAVAVFTRKD